MEPYVDGFIDTPSGFVPRVRTTLCASDILGTIGARSGFIRSNYRVVPGLYCSGNPTQDSPVLVTANYKLSFDALRTELADINAWLLVIDTRGINVWCAAGKGLFSTEEVICGVIAARLPTIVTHRNIILPQLSATGVAARAVKKHSGFNVTYGPIRANDLPRFLKEGNTTDKAMRTVSFTLKERAELIPVELYLLGKILIIALLAGFLISGIGPDIFSLSAAWHRGTNAASATVTGILAGCVLVPLFLNRLPWRMFWPKGALTGLIAGTIIAVLSDMPDPLSITAMIMWTATVASYLAMNFTGSTPFTSPTGVEHEMHRGIPLQAAAALIAIVLWTYAPFVG